MDAVITPQELSGSLRAIASKSVAHRALACAALCEGVTNVECNASSDDIDATIRCLDALGARIARTRDGFRVVPVNRNAARGATVTLDVGESGSTLRFLLPVAAALGARATFVGHGRLGERPLSPLLDQLRAHGVDISGDRLPLSLSGTLAGGRFMLPGDVSSQFASGLLLATPLVEDGVELLVTEPVESAPYIQLTVSVLARFGLAVTEGSGACDGTRFRSYLVTAGAVGSSPETFVVEGDWSNASFWLAAGALSGVGVEVTGLDGRSLQGDRSVCAALSLLGARVGRGAASAGARRDRPRAATLDVRNTPDLAAPLAAVAATAPGTTQLGGAARLRLKESDRLETIAAAICALGGHAWVVDDALAIAGGELTGGVVDAAGDHRIAMMAAVAATVATGPTTIVGAECVAKSYPAFFQDFSALGGHVRAEV